MPWVPGQSGNPEGGRLKARRFSTILERALVQEDLKAEADHRIRQGIEKIMDKIAAGDLASFQTLADRSDGKPAQTIQGSDGGPLIVEVMKYSEEKKDGDTG